MHTSHPRYAGSLRRARAFVFSRLRLVVIGCLGFLLLLPAAHALDASQASLLRDAQAFLKTLETNLALAQQTAGPGTETVPASKARLALVRLQGAIDAMAQVKARLDRLPAQDPAVQPVLQQFSTAATAVQVLQARLSGGAASPSASTTGTPSTPRANPSGENAPAGKPAATRLDYRQQEELKNARFYLSEVEGKAAALEQLVAQVKPVSDVTQLDFRLLQTGMNTVAEARQRAGLITPRLAALPAQGEGVAELAEGLRVSLGRIDACAQALEPIHAQLAALVDPKSHPRLPADTARIRELAAMYSDTTLFSSHRAQATARCRELGNAQAEHTRVMTAYAALLRQTTAESAALAAASAYFRERVSLFSAEMNSLRQGLPGAIDADFRKIQTMVQDAVSNQKPAFFTDGIPFEVRQLEEKMDLLDALDPSRTPALQTRLKELNAGLKRQQIALREAIIAANEVPRDEFQGGDRANLVRLASEAWRKVEPGAKILTVRIPSPAWRRDTRWRNQTGDWYKIDRSYLQAQVIVAHSDSMAVIRPIDLWKDHLEGDRVTATPQDTLKDELMAHDFLLLKKVK
ncbi:MAG: hypothetical protein U1F61_11610 [Opitutaceae bacterium]